jgi:hypothetical protein
MYFIPLYSLIWWGKKQNVTQGEYNPYKKFLESLGANMTKNDKKLISGKIS